MPIAGRVRTSPGRSTGSAPALRRAAVGMALVGLLAAGCGQPSGQQPDDSVAPTVSVPVQPTLTPDSTTPDDSIDPSAPGGGGLFDASQSLTSSSCTATGDVWSFTGTLKNTDSDKHTFTVAVFIVKTSDGSDVASKEVEVTVAPGDSAPVEAKAFHTGDTTGVECLTGVTVKGQ